MTKINTISSFRNDYGFLSNFYQIPLYVNGERYKSVEHAYQANKTLNVDARKLIQEAKTPSEAKKLGKAIQLRSDWEQVKYDLMLSFVRAKFNNPILKCMLVSTGDAQLIQENSWNDTTWGICKGVGKNLLGKILMQVRDEINKEQGDLVP